MAVAPVSAEVVDRIVAIVNQDIVTLAQLNQATAPYRKKIEASEQSDEQKKATLADMESKVLQQLIEQTLTQQEAEKFNIKVLDADVDDAIENVKATNGLDQNSLINALESEGIKYDDYRKKIRQDILQSMLISRAVRSKVIVTEGEIKAYYDDNLPQFQGVQKHKLCNILMDDAVAMDDVKDKLAKGADFKAVAKEFSMASNAGDGGELGVFDINNFSDVIKDAVQGLKKGDVSEIIPTGQGFQLIYVEDILMVDGKDLEQAQDQIRSVLYKKQVEEKFKQWITSLKENAHVKLML
ncbi:MAG: peptidyl-prolyl cis-trans isomerase [Desulfobacterales bacterium]|nr:peptidyl-prolyl cis-trans isomerase [Desulfobacterales bacterium]